jgi:hypothetical protein
MFVACCILALHTAQVSKRLHEIEGVLGIGDDVSTQLTETWLWQGDPITVTTNKRNNETKEEFEARHAARVAHAKKHQPPDDED